MSKHPINRVSAFAPFLMSLVAMLAVSKAIVNFKRYDPPMDEDGPWHVFMLMMSVQIPVMICFAFRHRRMFRAALPILATQIFIWVVSLGAAYYFTGVY